MPPATNILALYFAPTPGLEEQLTAGVVVMKSQLVGSKANPDDTAGSVELLEDKSGLTT